MIGRMMLIDVTTVYSFGEVETAISNATSRAELFADPCFRALFFDRLDSMMPSDGVLSLDVFDTLLIRDNSSELTRFVEIGECMARFLQGKTTRGRRQDKKPVSLTRGGVDAFLARYLGTKATYRARDRVKGYGEGSLTEIHTVSSRLLTGTSGARDKFIDIELEYESTRVQPNRLLLDYVERHAERGGSTILVTDMYMHADQVENLLRATGVDPEIFSSITSSADICISKASGLVFPEIESRLGLPASKFLHVGDSLKGDFRQPMTKGWRALHLPISVAEIEARRADHIATSDSLKEVFSIIPDIAMPA